MESVRASVVCAKQSRAAGSAAQESFPEESKAPFYEHTSEYQYAALPAPRVAFDVLKQQPRTTVAGFLLPLPVK